MAAAEENEDIIAGNVIGNVLMSGFLTEDRDDGSRIASRSDFVFPDQLGEEIPKSEILTITFMDSLDAMPSDAIDVSETQDGAVMLWLAKNGDYEDYYNMVIAGDGGVSVSSGIWLFSDYPALTSIAFNGCVYTGDVKKMSGMFSGCESLTALDLSGFDTSSVEDMSYMFENCSSLTSLDVSGLDTSSVTNMDGMFAGCSALQELDISGFDMSNVVSSANMLPEIGQQTQQETETTAVETAYGEGTYYVFAAKEYTDGSTDSGISEHCFYWLDGDLVFHEYDCIFDETEDGKGSYGKHPRDGWEYVSIEKCRYYQMTVEQVIEILETTGYTIDAGTVWRYDQFDY
ncbi:MAG: DUF285 domain-containing protein [Oscillospiraceae bacterium]|nr:DUF285 domain-containing protein [Oscillospiraceae bacterium]